MSNYTLNECLDPDEMHVLRFFFFFPERVSALGDKSTVHALLSTIYVLFSTVHRLKNIKNMSYGTIHTFKNYFVTVFSIFSFNKNKLYPNGRLIIGGVSSI